MGGWVMHPFAETYEGLAHLIIGKEALASLEQNSGVGALSICPFFLFLSPFHCDIAQHD